MKLKRRKSRRSLAHALSWFFFIHGLPPPATTAFLHHPTHHPLPHAKPALSPPVQLPISTATTLAQKAWRRRPGPLALSPRGHQVSAPAIHDDVMAVLASRDSSLKEVMEVVGRFGHGFDAECVGRALNRLSSFGSSSGPRAGEDLKLNEMVARDTRFQSLVRRIIDVHEGWDGKSLSLTINGLARLKYHPGSEVLGCLKERALPLLPTFKAQSLSLLFHGFVKLGYDLGEDFIVSWRTSVERHMDAFKPQELATMVNTLAKLPSYRPDDSFLQSLEVASRSKMAEFWPRDYANLISGLAALGHTPDTRLVRDLAVHLPPCVGRFKAQEVANVVHGVGKMGCEALPALLDPLLGRATDHFYQFKAEELAGLMHGLGKLGYEPRQPAFWEAFSLALPQRVADLKGQELANVLYGLSKLRRSVDPKLGEALLERLEACLDSDLIKPVELISALHSIGRLKLYPPPELVARVEVLSPDLPSLTAWDVATLLTSFGLLRFYPGDRFMGVVEGELPRLLSQGKARDVAEIVAGMGSINYLPYEQDECLQLIASRLEEFNSEELLKLLNGLAFWRHPELLADVETRLLHKLDQFSVAEVGKVLSLMGQGGYTPHAAFIRSAFRRVRHVVEAQGPLMLQRSGVPEFVSGLGRAAMGEGGDVVATSDLAWLEGHVEKSLVTSDLASIHSVVTGLVRVGGYQPSSAFLEAVAGRLQVFLYSEGGLTPAHVVGILNAFTALNYSYSASLWSTFVEWATSYLEEWDALTGRPFDIALLANTMAKAGQPGDTRWWAAVENATAASLEDFDSPSLVLLISALAQQEYTPHRQLLTGLVRQAAGPALEGFTSRGLTTFLQSMAVLRYYPGRRVMAAFLDTFTSHLEAMGQGEGEETSKRCLVVLPEVVLTFRHYPKEAFLDAVEERVGPGLLRHGKFVGRTVGMLASFERRLSGPGLDALVQGLRALPALRQARSPSLPLGETSLLLWGLAAMGVPGDHPVWEVPLAAASEGLAAGLGGGGGGGEEPEPIGANILRRLRQVERYFKTLSHSKPPVDLDRFSGVLQRALKASPPLKPPQPKVQAAQEVQEACRGLEGWSMEWGHGWEDVHAHGIVTEEKSGRAYALMIMGAHDFFHRNRPDKLVGESTFVMRLLEASGAFAGTAIINLESWASCVDEDKRRAMLRQALQV